MLKLNPEFYCDFCGKRIEGETVHSVRIGFVDDSMDFVPAMDEGYHYRDKHYCEKCHNLLDTLQPEDIKGADPEEPEVPDEDPDWAKLKAEETTIEEPAQGEPETEPEPPVPDKTDSKKNKEKLSYKSIHKNDYTGPVKRGQKDLPALNAMLEAGWSGKKCAEEFGISQGTISKHKHEIDAMKDAGTWEAYCEEKRK